MPRNISTNPPADHHRDQGQQFFDGTGAQIKFGFINKNFTHKPLARSPASVRWKKRDDEWIARAIPDGDGKARLIYHWPLQDRKGRELTPRVPNVGDEDVLFKLGALGIMAQRNQVDGSAKKSGKRAMVEFHRERIESKKGLKEAVYGNKYGRKFKVAGHQVREAFEDHDSKFGQTSEKGVGRWAYERKIEALLYDREALGDPILAFRSFRALQLVMGRSDLSTEGRNSLERSLRLWQRLTIEDREWRGDDKRRWRKRLPPPIAKIVWPESPGDQIYIRLRAKWMPVFASSYALRVTFPLAVSFSSPAALNLTLLMANWFEKDDSELIFTRPVDQICALLGVPGKERWKRVLNLRSAIQSVHRNRPGQYSMRIKDGKFIASTASERERQKGKSRSAVSEREERLNQNQQMERGQMEAAMERQGLGDG